MSNKSVVSRLLWGGVFLLCFGTAALAADVSKLVSQAREQVNSQSYDAAEGTLKRALSKQKDNLEARFLLARVSELREDYRKAIKRYKYLLFLKPKQVPAMAGIARSAEKLGDAKQARQTYLTISRQQPDQLKWLFEAMRIEMEKTSVKYNVTTERRLKTLIQAKYREPESLKYLIDYYHTVGAGYKAERYEKMLADAGTPAIPQHKKAASTETAHGSQPKTEPGSFGRLIKKVSKNIRPASTSKSTAEKMKKAPHFFGDAKKSWKITLRNLERIKSKAEAGDPYYQAILGEEYLNGDSVKRYPEKALKWLQLAAKKKHPIGLYNLAVMYDKGYEVKSNRRRARVLYREALLGMKWLARKGNPRAQRDLGSMYDHGDGMAIDDAEAVKWYRKAADQGNAGAQYRLGDMFYYGWGVKKDKPKAVKWYRKAADRGIAEAQFILGLKYDLGEGVKKNHAEAVKWYRKAADRGIAEAQLMLGSIYDKGEGVKKDIAKAARWYRKAADRGSGKAQYNLGLGYDKGKGVRKDRAEAVKWYRKAAKQGVLRSQVALAERYSNGEGVRKDRAEAVKWYRKAAAQENPGNDYDLRLMFMSQCNMGNMYIKGLGVKQDYAESLKWYKKCAEGKSDYVWTAEARKKTLEIDAKTGLLIYYDIKGNGLAVNLEAEEMAKRAIKAYGAGLEDVGKTSFMQAVKTDPLFLYGNDTWYNLYKYNLPLSLAGEILLAVRPEKEGTPGFWFDYAHTANLAGQPTLALAAVKKLEQINGNVSDEKKRKEIQSVTAILKADAYIQMGRDKDAYTALLENGEMDKEDSALVNYINHWARPLLKDKKKLSLLTGIEESKWTGTYAMPKPQAFQNIETGKLIQPAAPPKLMAAPKAKKKTNAPARKPAQKGKEPDVEILD